MEPTHHYASAGGVVTDNAGRVLLIERDVVRDGRSVHEVRLPKGHVEAGESDADAALREIREETGYGDLAVTADLGTAAVDFEHRGEAIRRTDHYFLMAVRLPSRPPTPTPMSDEERAFRVCWAADLRAAEESLTYQSERQFVRRARQMREPATSDQDPAG